MAFSLLTNSGCQKKPLDYPFPVRTQIEWKNIFSSPENFYLVYIYSPFCGHCETIKSIMLEYAQKPNQPFYSLVFSDEVIVSFQSSVNVNIITDLKIKGTPTLLIVENHWIKENIAGAQEISMHFSQGKFRL